MRRWRGKVLPLLALIPLFLLGSTAEATLESQLDFGTFSAPKETTREVSLRVPVDASATALEIWLESDLECAERRRALPAARMTIGGETGVYALTTTPVDVPLDEWEGGGDSRTVTFLVSYSVSPSDLPAVYRSHLRVREMGGNGGEIRLPVQVTVMPWTALETENERLLVTRVSFDASVLLTDFPGYIRIASNVPWVLIGGLGSNEFLPDGNLRFKIFSGPDSEVHEFHPRGIPLTEGPTAIAAGNATTGAGSYWTELLFALTIEEYTRIKGGRIDFDLLLAVYPLEQ